ncbi:MAG: carbohydrate binding family 9 domain-containing protein [Myxococcaceae bacterium]|nr:carbohydrate binding family 9 domain-containing protein [Myxococcaceae bacterium]
MSPALVLVWLAAAPAEGAADGGEAGPVALKAVRTARAPVVDGRADDEGWAAAEPFSAFTQSYPVPGGPPSEQTELRVLFDDEALYVFVHCADRTPEEIVDTKGRRDAVPQSDKLDVYVDALADGRTAWYFEVNAGGSVGDGKIRQDTLKSRDWDGAWQSAVARTSEGWDAEFAIPLDLLQYSEGSLEGWGFHVRREVARTHEVVETVAISRSENALVSRFARLTGLESLSRKASFTAAPFATLRLTGNGAAYLPTADVGGELKLQLGSSWSLVASLNPDFGDAEVDDLVLNLANVEYFFPEKRPFFTDGLDALQPLEGAEDQQIFYSRRMGLDTPILGAARLNGGVGEKMKLTVLDVLVAGEVDPSKERALEAGEDPALVPLDPTVRFTPWRPLHLGPAWGLPAQVPPPTNLFAFGLRSRLVPGVFAGVQSTIKSALFEGCRPRVTADGVECPPLDAQVLALDLDARTPGGDWGFSGQVALSQVTGTGPGGRLLEEQVTLGRSVPGLGAHARGGKLGGSTWRAAVEFAETSPTLEMNDLGYQAYRNERVVGVRPELRRDEAFGPFLSASVAFKGELKWTADGTGRPKGQLAAIIAKSTFSNFTQLDCTLALETNRRDQRELKGVSVLFARPSYASAACAVTTDTSRPVSVLAEANVEHTFGSAPVPETLGGSGLVQLTARPSPSFQTVLSANLDLLRDGPRWLTTEGSDVSVALLSPDILTFTLGQTVAFTPALTLQVSGQLLTSRGRYGERFSVSTSDGRTVRFVDLTPQDPTADFDFHQAQLRLSAVLRWEIRPGAVASLVYRRDQTGERLGSPAPGLFEGALWEGPHQDTFLLKLVWTL